MIRIFDIAAKDLTQYLRERETFLFFLIMPLAFTFLFGYASGGFSGGPSDPRLPIGYMDRDGSLVSRKLQGLLAASEVIRLVPYNPLVAGDQAEMEKQVADEKLAAAVIVPAGYGHDMLDGRRPKLSMVGSTNSTVGTTIEAELVSRAVRLEGAVRTAVTLEEVSGSQARFDYTLDDALSRWDKPPIRVAATISAAAEAAKRASSNQALAHTAPGMMLQFAIAGLLVAAQLLVTERKSRTLQRLMTTRTSRSQILLGHYLAMLVLILLQFLLLLAFGQFVLQVNYLRVPQATLMVAFTAALCIAGMGLLIGALARTSEQAVIFALVPMFLFAGLGGAWVPLEVTGETFQTIGHLSPIAWAMDGFKNITVRGLGSESVLVPAAVLTGYAVLFIFLAVLKFSRE